MYSEERMPLVHATVVEFAVELMQIPLQLRPVLADNASLFQGKNVALERGGQVFCILSSGLSLKGEGGGLHSMQYLFLVLSQEVRGAPLYTCCLFLVLSQEGGEGGLHCMQYLFLVLSQEGGGGGGAPLYACCLFLVLSQEGGEGGLHCMQYLFLVLSQEGGGEGSTVCMLSVSCLVSGGGGGGLHCIHVVCFLSCLML